MHKLVVRPLKEHLYRLFVDEYTRNGAIEQLADNIQYARTKTLAELGIQEKIVLPTGGALEHICDYLTSLQAVDSPLAKLENLLACTANIYHSVSNAILSAIVTLETIHPTSICSIQLRFKLHIHSFFLI